MKKFATIIVAGVMAFGLLAPAMSTPVLAQVSDGLEATKTEELEGKSINGENGVVNIAVNIFLWVIGVISVMMLIFGGYKYIMSAGDTQKLQSAKSTIQYAIIGLVVAIFSYAIVSFLVDKL